MIGGVVGWLESFWELSALCATANVVPRTTAPIESRDLIVTATHNAVSTSPSQYREDLKNTAGADV